MLRALLLLLTSLTLVMADPPVISNPGFEDGLTGWRPLWVRTEGSGTVSLDPKEKHDGVNAARIEHHDSRDWSFEPDKVFDVTPGDLFELRGWVKMDAQPGANVILSVATWDAAGKVQSWSYGEKVLSHTAGWTLLKSRFAIPPGVARMQVRVIGEGSATVWVDEVTIEKKGSLADLRRKDLPATFTIENAALTVRTLTQEATLEVTDKRTGRTWKQAPPAGVVLVDARADVAAMILTLTLFDFANDLKMVSKVNLDGDKPEFTVSFIDEGIGEGQVTAPICFPGPFLTQPGDRLIIPLNEGISYPVEDPAVSTMRLVAYGGHGICMAFWGVTDGKAGQMAIIESPDDAAVHLERIDKRLVVAPQWDATKGKFGYPRRLRYIFLDQGGHVAMAKRYRAYAQSIGLFRTLEDKRKENPNVDKLIGAVNVWCWDKNSVPLVKEMQAAGIEHILWSNAQSPENLKAMNELGVLTSRYDIYQDVMDPAQFPLLQYVHPDWPKGAWPDDVIRDAHGDWQKGWEIEGKDGKMHPCAVLSDAVALKYAQERIPAELVNSPYECRFIDTTTASAWREDYNPAHPMTRADCRRARMDLLRYISHGLRLVTGSETGHDAAVPVVDYFEGMLSLAPYRVPDSGRAMSRIWDDVPAEVAKFQVGENYRLPLWELVYHECVVAHWYWGDYNNKLPALWDKRDLFNILYATAPMFMFERDTWEKNKARFVQSYEHIAPVTRALGYTEMTDHRFLTDDRTVQQTAFANGALVTVNFGSQPFTHPDGVVTPGGGFRFEPGAKQ